MRWFVLSFWFILRCCRLLSKWPVSWMPPAQFILTLGQQSQAERLRTVCQYVCYDPRAQHTHRVIQSPPTPVENYDMLPFSIHVCFSFSAAVCFILMLLCFVWYGAAAMHFYSLSYITFLFKISFCIFLFCRFGLWVSVCMGVHVCRLKVAACVE